MVLKGVTVSGCGIMTGQVKVAYGDGELDKVNVGDILVIPAAYPEFTLALSKVKAIVSQVGNRTCHLANVCREKDTPLLVAVNGAMRLKDGQMVTVDMNDGTVTVHDNREGGD